jgi:hypothetical protein
MLNSHSTVDQPLHLGLYMGTWMSNNADADASDNYTLRKIHRPPEPALPPLPPSLNGQFYQLIPLRLFCFFLFFLILLPHIYSPCYIPTSIYNTHTPTFPPSPSYVLVPIPIPLPLPSPIVCPTQHTPLCSCTHSSQSLILYYTHRVTSTLHNSSLSSTKKKKKQTLLQKMSIVEL